MISRFQFKAIPFTREIAVEDRFQLPYLEKEVDFLKQVVQQRMSATVIAPAGTGKTLLLRTLKNSLPEARYKVHYIKITGLSKRDMCREICIAIGAKPASNYPSCVRSIQDHMEKCIGTEGIRTVVLVDEAHDLNTTVLSMFRILTNFDMDSRLVVSLIFAGQMSLKTMLRKDEVDAITKRLSHCSELRLLSREESKSYLQHRIRLVGTKPFPFDDRATEALFELSRGNMRALDELSRKALEMANQAECETVDQNHVLAAREKLPY
jgi:general secretion pathway protein A